MTDTRDLFERTFALNSRQQMKRHDGSYFYADIQAKWEGWQAREKIAAAPAPSDPALKPWDDLATFVAERFPAPEPVAWVTKAALRHWAEHKGEGPQEYTFLPRALNAWDMQEDLQVPLYAAPAPSAPKVMIGAPYPGMNEPVSDEEIARFDAGLREALDAPAPSDAQDAARYRWLRTHPQEPENVGGAIHFTFAIARPEPHQWCLDNVEREAMDAAIDAAMKAE
jgi:hypothetical protein